MKCKGIASLEFLIAFSCLLAILSLYLHSLNSFNSRAFSSSEFQLAKSNALECAFSIDSLAANTGFEISSFGFKCFSDSNYSIASRVKSRTASVPLLAKSALSPSSNGFLIEVEINEHYK